MLISLKACWEEYSVWWSGLAIKVASQVSDCMLRDAGRELGKDWIGGGEARQGEVGGVGQVSERTENKRNYDG
ncbi:hypothetical protein E2C01_083110 [Portunus trituberculatus]|uniref:Uncharacterized protein n=1 Tax=Portunus trituberculatus TaxID=210409 RepID=A0A5B7IWB9_PORTR|nr:hypothetical protein [Portunus trituberculatus]